MDLAAAKAVITGGASGLGYATAQRVIGAGGQVVLLDINDEQGNASAAKLGDLASFITVDVADEDSVKDAISQVNETQATSMQMKRDFETGVGDRSLAEVMIASQKADLSFRAMTEVRNKLVTAGSKTRGSASCST